MSSRSSSSLNETFTKYPYLSTTTFPQDGHIPGPVYVYNQWIVTVVPTRRRSNAVRIFVNDPWGAVKRQVCLRRCKRLARGPGDYRLPRVVLAEFSSVESLSVDSSRVARCRLALRRPSSRASSPSLMIFT